jgi:hypothetical protein
MSGWTLKLGTGTGYTSNAGQWWYQFKDDQGYNYYATDPALSPDAKKLALTNGGDHTRQAVGVSRRPRGQGIGGKRAPARAPGAPPWRVRAHPANEWRVVEPQAQ